MSRILPLFAVCVVLAGCGSKSELSTEGSTTGLAGTGQGNRLVEKPRDSNDAVAPRLRIACESGAQMLLTHSDSFLEDRSSLFLPYPEGRDRAPTIVASGKEKLLLIHADAGLTGGLKVFLSEFDYINRKETKRLELARPSVDESVYDGIGLPLPKLAAVSPAGDLFAVRDTGGGYSLRATRSPENERGRWSTAALNPRWEEGIVFFDEFRAGKIRQSFARISRDGSLSALEPVPAPALGSGAYQLGLRRFDANTLVWLEWSNGTALIRSMDLRSRRTSESRVSGEGYGPAFAIHKLKEGRRIVLQTRGQLRFFALEGSRLVSAGDALYPKSVKERIASGSFAWQTGELYSPREDQLFVVLPEAWGLHLFAVDEGQSYRRLGYYECLNPDFLEEK